MTRNFSPSFLLRYLPSPNVGLTPPVIYNRGSDAGRESNRLWTRTRDRYTRAGFPECVVSTMSGSLPETTQDRTQNTHTPYPRIEIKISDPTGNRTRVAGLKGRDSTAHVTATRRTLDLCNILLMCQPTALLRASGSAQGG